MRLNEIIDTRDDPTLRDPPPKIRKTERMRKKLRQMKRRTPPGGTIRTTDERYPHGGGMFSGMF